MKKKVVLTLLFLMSLAPMLLNQYGGARGVQEITGLINLLNPIGIISAVLYLLGIWCNFKNTKLKNAFSIIGASGIIVSEIYEFLTWHILTVTGEFNIKHSIRLAYPEFYFGLFASVAMLICYLLLSDRFEKCPKCCQFGNANIDITKINIAASDIPVEFDGYKIVQISDFHNKEFGNNNEVLLNIIQESNPDIIVVTGDIIDGRKVNIDIVARFIEHAVKIAPIYYVPGNHEAALEEYSELADKMESLGANILFNRFVKLKNGSSAINLVGFADPRFADNLGLDTASVFNKYLGEMNIDTNYYTILLSHRPEAFDYYVKNNIDLVFCGHAHGGQIRLPFIGGVFAPNQGLFPKYTSGVYKGGNTNMIVSRGLGDSVFPLRINNNPEIIFATLNKE